MFERFITGLQQRILETVGQAESFQEDQNFVKQLEEFRLTRLKIKDLCDKARAFITAEAHARAARVNYVFYLFFGKHKKLLSSHLFTVHGIPILLRIRRS